MAGFAHLYSIGQGDAQVFNANNIVGTYAQQLQQQELRRQKEREALEKDFDKINYDGVRPAESEYFKGKYDELKSTYNEVYNAKNDAEKLKLLSRYEALKKGLSSEVMNSKQVNKEDQTIAATMLRTPEYQRPKNWQDMLRARIATPHQSKDFGNYSIDKFASRAEPFDTNKDLDDLAKMSAKQVSNEIVVGKGIDQKRAWREGLQLDENVFKSRLLERLSTSDQARDSYLNGLPPTEENLKDVVDASWDIVKDKYALKTRLGDYVNPSGRDLALTERKASIRDSHEKTSASKPAIYRQDIINRIIDQVPGSGEEIVAAAEASGRYGKEKVKVITSNGRVVGFKIPAESGISLNNKGAYKVYFDPNDRKDAVIKINTLIGDLTGERVNLSALMTEGGTKKVVGGRGVSEFEKKTESAKAGFSIDSYLKKKGLK